MKCQHCGYCCQVDTERITTLLDISRWKREKRKDILDHVKMVDGIFPAGFKEDKCPFYDDSKEMKCLIEDTKPYVCRRFPLNKKHAMSYTNGKCEIFAKNI